MFHCSLSWSLENYETRVNITSDHLSIFTIHPPEYRLYLLLHDHMTIEKYRVRVIESVYLILYKKGELRIQHLLHLVHASILKKDSHRSTQSLLLLTQCCLTISYYAPKQVKSVAPRLSVDATYATCQEQKFSNSESVMSHILPNSTGKNLFWCF